MRQKPGGRERPFTAAERFAVDRVAFSWRARFPLVGPLSLEAVDCYDETSGKLEVRLLGLPLQRQKGPETLAGEAIRYLAELPWAPFAMTANRELQWRELDEGHVEVAAMVRGRRVAVTFEFDAAGDIRRASSADRRLELRGEWTARPWAGEYPEYETHSGVRIPTSAEVYWELPEGRFVYWRGRITSLELLDDPLGPDT